VNVGMLLLQVPTCVLGVDVGQLVVGDVVVEQLVILGVDSPWQVVAKMDVLPVWLSIDRERLTPSVWMFDN